MNKQEFIAKIIMLNWEQVTTDNNPLKMFLKKDMLLRIYILNDTNITTHIKGARFTANNYNEAFNYILKRSS